MATSLATITALLKDRVRDQSGQSIDFTANGFRAINSTLNIWSEVHDWPWTIKTLQFNYNPGIDWYALDGTISDFKYPLTLKLYKPAMRYPEFWMVSPLRFDSAAVYSRRFAISNIGTVQSIRMKSVDGTSASLNTATAYNQNGTWIGDGTVITRVATDNYEGYSLTSSVSFSFNGTSGTLTNDGNTYTTFTPLDLTQFQNRSNIYVDIDIPAITNLTSFSLKWGTNSTNYYSATASTDYIGATFVTGWNRVKFSWSTTPTTVGAPTITSIKYLQLTFTCSGSTNLGLFRIQNFFVSENVPVILTYYSTNMVQAAVANGSAQGQVFADATKTTDFPLWTGRWDVATEAFVDSCLQILFWMTGEIQDLQIAMSKVQDIIKPLKERFPSQRRYPTMQMVTDTNYQSNGNGGGYNNTQDW